MQLLINTAEHPKARAALKGGITILRDMIKVCASALLKRCSRQAIQQLQFTSRPFKNLAFVRWKLGCICSEACSESCTAQAMKYSHNNYTTLITMTENRSLLAFSKQSSAALGNYPWLESFAFPTQKPVKSVLGNPWHKKLPGDAGGSCCLWTDHRIAYV